MTMLMTKNIEDQERFESYVASFPSVFGRADQLLRFRAYLRGLLEPTYRKNVEGIAKAAAAVLDIPVNLSQSLQHFISQSPWSHRDLFSEVRRLSTTLRDDARATWIIHDGVFPKRGQHSVGVQRQFARQAGRKMNCQLGVFVSQVGPCGYYPLAAQLYLPSYWLRENHHAREKLLPLDVREPASKMSIALGLIDDLMKDGERLRPVSAEAGYLSTQEFTEGVQERGLLIRENAPDLVSLAHEGFDWMRSRLGLDHFEGRTWVGWHHHVSLVVAAYHYLACHGRDVEGLPFPSARRSG
jgi:SRSO17 transposase